MDLRKTIRDLNNIDEVKGMKNIERQMDTFKERIETLHRLLDDTNAKLIARAEEVDELKRMLSIQVESNREIQLRMEEAGKKLLYGNQEWEIQQTGGLTLDGFIRGQKNKLSDKLIKNAMYGEAFAPKTELSESHIDLDTICDTKKVLKNSMYGRIGTINHSGELKRPEWAKPLIELLGKGYIPGIVLLSDTRAGELNDELLNNLSPTMFTIEDRMRTVYKLSAIKNKQFLYKMNTAGINYALVLVPPSTVYAEDAFHVKTHELVLLQGSLVNNKTQENNSTIGTMIMSINEIAKVLIPGYQIVCTDVLDFVTDIENGQTHLNGAMPNYKIVVHVGIVAKHINTYEKHKAGAEFTNGTLSNKLEGIKNLIL